MILAMTEHLKDLPQTGWGVIGLVAAGFIFIVIQLARGLSTQKQINTAVNHRNLGEPTLVSMVADIHADHRQLRNDIAVIRGEVSGLQIWRAGFADSELGSAGQISDVLKEIRNDITYCKSVQEQTRKEIKEYGCPVKLKTHDKCANPHP